MHKSFRETTEIHKFEEQQNITIETSISFKQAGINWYNSLEEKGGYYLHVTPIKINGFFRETQIGEGFKYLVLEVERQSKKRLETAIEIAKDHKDRLIAIAVNRKLNQLNERKKSA